MLAAFQHMQQKYGIVPNSFDIVNEPNLGVWNPQHVAANLLAVKRRLNQAGFSPRFIGPTSSGALSSIQYFDTMMRVPRVAQALNVLSYHRYGVTVPSYLTDIANRGAQHRMQTAMLEHIGSGYVDLHEDLTVANVSTWQQFGLTATEYATSLADVTISAGQVVSASIPAVGALTVYAK